MAVPVAIRTEWDGPFRRGRKSGWSYLLEKPGKVPLNGPHETGRAKAEGFITRVGFVCTFM